VNSIQSRLQSHNRPYLNLGGGLGIDYLNPKVNCIANFSDYFSTIHQWLKPGDKQSIHFELGRSLVGQCGQLYTRVQYTKPSQSHNFVVVDAGMNALIRPALYGALHHIENISKKTYPQINTMMWLVQFVKLPIFWESRLIFLTPNGAICWLFIHAEPMPSQWHRTITSENDHKVFILMVTQPWNPHSTTLLCQKIYTT